MAIRLEGPWRGGWALDWHTLASTLRPDGSFDTVRSEIGQALYDLKYSGKRAFRVADARFRGKRVLLFEDLYRSGATLAEITRTLTDQGDVGRVYVLTLTRTRVRR